MSNISTEKRVNDYIKISFVGVILLIIALLVPYYIRPNRFYWLWSLMYDGSTVRFNRYLYNLAYKVIFSLLIVLRIFKIAKQVNKAKNGNEDIDTYKKKLTKSSIYIMIFTVIYVILNGLCLPYDIDLVDLMAGNDFVIQRACSPFSISININLALHIFLLFLGAILVIIGGQLYGKEPKKLDEIQETISPAQPIQNASIIFCGKCGYKNENIDTFCLGCGSPLSKSTKIVDDKEDIVDVSQDEIGEKGFSKKFPDVVVTKKDMYYVLISGLLLSIIGGVLLAVGQSLEGFYSSDDAYYQVIGTSAGLLIAGVIFLILYFLAPDTAKAIIAISKGNRRQQRAKRNAKK